MDNFQQSFDQNLGGGGSYQYGAPRSSRVTSIIAITMLSSSLIGTGAMAFWQFQEKQALKDAQVALQAASASYNSSDVVALVRQRDTLDRAKTLINSHPIPTSLIDFLAAHTEATVVWSDLTYSRGNAADKDFADSMHLSGTADRYPGLMAQLAHFRDRSLVGQAVTSVDLESYNYDDKTQLVTFALKLTLNPHYVELPQVSSRGAINDVSMTPAPAPVSVPTPPAPTSVATNTVPVKPAAPATTTPAATSSQGAR